MTFLEVWDRAEGGQEPPLSYSGGDSLAMRAVRKGLGMRGAGSSRTFWDDFAQVCADPDGVSDLLGVRPEQVAGWADKVRQAVSRALREDGGRGRGNTVVPTGL